MNTLGTIDNPDHPFHADAMPLAIGRLEGRLGALEVRVARHEDWVGTKLLSLEGKMDGLDGKLDTVIGKQQANAAIMTFGKWLFGVLAALSGWVAFLRAH